MTLTEQRLLLASMDRTDNRLYRERQPWSWRACIAVWAVLSAIGWTFLAALLLSLACLTPMWW